MMTLTSSSFEEGQDIPQKHGKKIENVSPQLSWSDAPEETKTFALAVVDWHPVADRYVHWLVVDMDASVTSLDEGAAGTAMPPGSREVRPYAGPFPPSGTHDYEFTMYALKTDKLDVPEGASLDAFNEAVEPQTLTTAKLVGRFRKLGTN